MLLVSCPDPPRTCEKEGLEFWASFLVKWGGVAPQSESSNQIAERVIICNDVGNRARDLALQTKGKLLLQLICYVLSCSKVGCSLLEFCKPCLAYWASSRLLAAARYSTTVLLEADAGSREWRRSDTGRAIVQTAQLGIIHHSILHAACKCMGKSNAIITFFMSFDHAPCDKKSRSEHQTLFPAFRGGSGNKTSMLCTSTPNFELGEEQCIKCWKAATVNHSHPRDYACAILAQGYFA